MKARAVPNYTTVLGRLLTRMLSVWEAGSGYEVSRRADGEPTRGTDDQVSRHASQKTPWKKSSDTPTTPGVIIRNVRDAMKAQCSQPAIVNLGPVLALLTMLRSRQPRRHRGSRPELGLPPGCVLAARYSSR